MRSTYRCRKETMVNSFIARELATGHIRGLTAPTGAR